MLNPIWWWNMMKSVILWRHLKHWSMIKTSSLTGDGCMNMWGGTCLEQNNVVAITAHICSGKAQANLVKMARSDPHIIAICRQILASSPALSLWFSLSRRIQGAKREGGLCTWQCAGQEGHPNNMILPGSLSFLLFLSDQRYLKLRGCHSKTSPL